MPSHQELGTKKNKETSSQNFSALDLFVSSFFPKRKRTKINKKHVESGGTLKIPKGKEVQKEKGGYQTWFQNTSLKHVVFFLYDSFSSL